MAVAEYLRPSLVLFFFLRQFNRAAIRPNTVTWRIGYHLAFGVGMNWFALWRLGIVGHHLFLFQGFIIGVARRRIDRRLIRLLPGRLLAHCSRGCQNAVATAAAVTAFSVTVAAPAPVIVPVGVPVYCEPALTTTTPVTVPEPVKAAEVSSTPEATDVFWLPGTALLGCTRPGGGKAAAAKVAPPDGAPV